MKKLSFKNKSPNLFREKVQTPSTLSLAAPLSFGIFRGHLKQIGKALIYFFKLLNVHTVLCQQELYCWQTGFSFSRHFHSLGTA